MRSLTANPDDINTEFALVNLLAKLKGPAAAREELVSKVNAGKNVDVYKIALAKLDFAEGKTTEGVNSLKKLIGTMQAGSKQNAARIVLAEMYLSKNDVASAEPVIADVLKNDSRNTEALRLRAGILVNRGQIDNAVGDLRQALNDQPHSPSLLASLANAYERGGKIELASQAYSDAMTSSRYSPTYGLNYFRFLQRRSLNDQAERVLTELANRNPNDVNVLSELAKTKLAHRDYVAAHQIADKDSQHQ